MQVVGGGRSLWIYTLLFIFLKLWGRLLASTSSAVLPAPTLDIYSSSEDTVVLVCRAPEGHHGSLFKLYQKTDEVDSLNLQSGENEVHFTVKIAESDRGRHGIFCCMYRDQEGVYSRVSPYLELQHPKAPAPTYISIQSPVLSVDPPSGVVQRGGTLTFSCTVPAPAPYLQSQSNKPVKFLLMRTAMHEGGTSVVLPPPANQVSNPEPQPGVFTVGPVRGGEEGEYSCIYQITGRRRLVNSSVSNLVKVSITEPTLPVPTLVLQQQTDVWHLLCTGSPAYPGALFYLHLAGIDPPIATQRAKLIRHHATFPVPVQDAAVAQYQCQYSVLLGGERSHSGRSLSVAVTKGTSSPPLKSSSGVDWPLVLGSFSTVVLFLASFTLLAVVAHRKVKAATQAKKKREEAQFWTQVHAQDHDGDLPLGHASYTSQDWTSGNTETASRSHHWNALSTFTSPSH